MSRKFQDELELTFIGEDDDLDEFMLKLREFVEELAKEHNIEID